MSPSTPNDQRSRITILVMCGILVVMTELCEIPAAQRTNLAAASLIGVCAIGTLSGSVNKNSMGLQHRKREETRQKMNQRIQLQLATLGHKFPHVPDVTHGSETRSESQR